MLCERCKKKKAVMFYNENINGKVRSFNLCTDCVSLMQQSGELEDLSSPFSHTASPFVNTEREHDPFDDFFGLSVPDSASSSASSATCPGCGASWVNVVKQRKIPCSLCYSTFTNELGVLLLPLRVSAPYNGKVPRFHRRKQELTLQIQGLKQKLNDAVCAEQFETAAALRDQIRELEAAL